MPDLVVTVDSTTKQLPESVRTKLAADLPPGISSWDDLEDKPPVIAAGDTATEARTAIGATGSPNGTVTGIAIYNAVEDLPDPGVVGVLYLVLDGS